MIFRKGFIPFEELVFPLKNVELARLGGSRLSPLSFSCFNHEGNDPSASYFTTSNTSFGTFERNLFSLDYFQTIRSL
mgnify:CR=1 FL=1